MPLPRIVACKIEVAVITGPVGVRIVLVLPKGSIVWEPSLTAIAIRHQTVGVQKPKVWSATYRMWEIDFVFGRIAWKTRVQRRSHCQQGMGV